MTIAPGRRKKRALGSLIGEGALMRRYRAARHDAVLGFDWAAIPYNRIAVVNLLVSGRPRGDYLEIGCASNLLFDAVMAERKTGVDPVSGGTHRQTSDAFFAQNPDARFDVIFIDGLHVYDQVRRDLVHALRAVRPGGWIALHDLLPRDWVEEHVPQISTAGWTGDGWKVAFELAACRSVDFRLLAVDHGVGVLRVLEDPPVLPDMRGELERLRFVWLHEHLAELPLVDWARGRAWIDAHLAG